MRRDVQPAREVARLILFLTLSLPVVVLLLWVAAPGHMGGGRASWYDAALSMIAAGLYLIGLGWMIRIYRSRPKDSEAEWRYRDMARLPTPGWSGNGHMPTGRLIGGRAVRQDPARAGGPGGGRTDAAAMREDVRAARREARSMIGAAIVWGLLVGVAWTQSGAFDMTFGPEFPLLGFLPPRLTPGIAALAVYLVGLAWMVRIYRTSHLEPETSSWRYHDVSGEPHQP